ncbi:hypothetical protein FA15DRAFT_700140 [Coprinopsis marcescibilis]|uniref:Uncharacterized protein n=1 Tax=Coprinopsis marcescibilis TaxID=230819 RepID=A0A5C3LA59_COPMA|nr:hypothetical protein FA15DRAFT_700140 [Coprinopsis marcescibilis]
MDDSESSRVSSVTPGDSELEELRGMINQDNNDDDTGDFTHSSQPGTPLNRANPSRGTSAVIQAHRLANRLSLGPYTKQLESYADEDPATRSLLLYGKILSLEHKLTAICSPSGTYVVEKPLMDNIKNYVLAVLLSPKLSSYKGEFPRERVLAVIKHLNINVPATMNTDRHIYKVVREAVGSELTQARARIKKAIQQSKDSKQSIYQLATSLVDNTKCAVSVALCARLALLRKVYSEEGKSGAKYWDFVDARLVSIRDVADGKEDKIQIMFTKMLNKDREIYGTTLQQVLSTQSANDWQNSVDDALDSDRAAATQN